MRVAACLLVRDEVFDIGSWLAWYHVLGFDACIVYDDDSTDGTREIVAAAAKAQDIRLLRSVGSRNENHAARQNLSYIDAIERFRQEFDWIGFFDSDEYLRLMDCTSITDFLRRFPEGGAVSVNWCCYGSSGHVLRPTVPPIEAYTWHSDENSPINRHVKTLLHLDSWTGKYLNMHCFDVAAGTAVNSSGLPVEWCETPGITNSMPDWSIAKVMHYQCRSMEHFVHRLKRAPFLPRTTALWKACDVNDIEDKMSASITDAVTTQIARYASNTSGSSAYQPIDESGRVAGERPDYGLVIDVGVADGNDTAFYLAKGFRVIGVEADPQACAALTIRFREEIGSGRLTILNYAVSGAFGQTIELFVHNVHQGISGIAKRAEVQDDYRTFKVPTIDWKTLLVQGGVPHYLKIDVEGSEPPFMESMLTATDYPEFISVECYSFLPIVLLSRMGYTRFKIVDQNPAGGFQLPAQQAEGETIVWDQFSHSSGPFGRDVFRDANWEDFSAVKASWEKARAFMDRTWFDCHAWKPI